MTTKQKTRGNFCLTLTNFIIEFSYLHILFSKLALIMQLMLFYTYMNYFDLLAQMPPFALFIIFLWSLLWKGLALWRAVRNEQRNWFIALLVVNSIGILEIAYLFGFAKKKMKLEELKFWELMQKSSS